MREREEGVVAIHLPIGPLKNPLCVVSRYRDANPVPTSPVADLEVKNIKGSAWIGMESTGRWSYCLESFYPKCHYEYQEMGVGVGWGGVA